MTSNHYRGVPTSYRDGYALTQGMAKAANRHVSAIEYDGSVITEILMESGAVGERDMKDQVSQSNIVSVSIDRTR